MTTKAAETVVEETSSTKGVINSIKMDDGTIVDFAGKTRLKKSYSISPEGKVSVRMDFVNGEVRHFTVPDSLLLQFAAHGAVQKLGDETSGLTDIEDAVEAVDSLMDRLNKGEWVMKREVSGLAGASSLVRALVEASGKTAHEIRDYLADKTNAEKLALRKNGAIAPIIARLEANKKKKERPKNAIDTDSMLAGLGVGVASEDAAAE